MKKSRDDFPDLMSPMLVKELRQGMRTKSFVTAFVVFQVVMVVMMSLFAMDYAGNPESFRVKEMNGTFWVMCALLLLLVMPLRGVMSISSEEKAQTLELIFLTRLTAWRIVLGKWASLMFQSLLFTLAVLPYAVLRYFFGSVNLLEDLLILAVLLWGSALLTAAMVGISGFSGFVKGALLLLGGIPCSIAATILGEILFGGPVSRAFGFHVTPPLAIWLLLLANSLLLGLYFLELAAAQIAPDAENHIMRKRLLVLACVGLTVLTLALDLPKELIYVQFAVSSVALGFCCAEGMCSGRPLMMAHVENFAWGRVSAWLGRLFYPDWPSSSRFVFLAVALQVLILISVPGIDEDIQRRFLLAVLSVGCALLTPLLIFSLVMKRWKQQPVPFFIVQITIMIISFFAIFAHGITNDRFPLFVMALLPPSGFWLSLSGSLIDKNLGLHLTSAVLGLLLAFIFVAVRSIGYWREVARMEASVLARRAGQRKSKAAVESPVEPGA